jgi:8-oxo-dGTP pyrophosphatase MutT (NUDIX family)
MSSAQANDDAEIAAGIILFRQGPGEREFLLLRNAKHRSWGFAKGHAEHDENPEETARRETLEETGIFEFDLVPGFEERIEYFIRTSKGVRRRKIVVYYLAKTTRDAIRSDEHDLMEWIPAAIAKERIGHANLRQILERALERLDGPARDDRRRDGSDPNDARPPAM